MEILLAILLLPLFVAFGSKASRYGKGIDTMDYITLAAIICFIVAIGAL